MIPLTLARSLLLAVLASLGAAHAAPVGTWYDIDAPDGVLQSITYKSKTYSFVNASPAVYLDDQVWFYSSNITPQTPSNIAKVTEQEYGLAAGSLSIVSYCDSTSPVSCTSGANVTTLSTNTEQISTFTSSSPFDYLAVHLGLGELLFHWTVATDTFTLSGLPTASISNYRAYLGPQVLATPLPGAALLFASGLGAAGLLARRRAKQHGEATA